MHDFRGSDGSTGIGSVGARGSINIYNNVIWNISTPMQIGSRDNNTLRPSDQNVSNWVAQGYGYGSIDITSILVDASFISSVMSGNVPLNVQFTDTSTGTPTLWSWDFGDGAKSTDRNPTHSYSTAGTYTVTLTVSNEYKTDSKSVTITVLTDSNSSEESSGGSSGSSGSGGAGGTPESQSNIEAKEVSQTFVNSGKTVKFDFPRNATPIVSISFDSKKTAGKTTTIVEMLKGKSTLVIGLPSDEVYKYLNIWVGNSGFGDSNNIENAVICIKVEKTWIQNKKIDKSSINLNRFSDKKWNLLPTSISGEDEKYLYLVAKTPGFSPFAITGKTTTGTEIQPADENKTQNNTLSPLANAEQTPAQKENTDNSEKGSTKVPGFEVFCGLLSLFAIFLYGKVKRDK
jgi:PGF-pre-PGF domain-containing protein